jgi:RNA polymerase-binding transcription factor DksA
MLKHNETEKHRRQLIKLRHRLDKRITALREEILATAQPDFEGADSEGQLDIGALAGHAFEHDLNASLFGSKEQVREEVEAALQRIADGSFGRCADCGKPISRVRLNFVPYARHCMSCARTLSHR